MKKIDFEAHFYTPEYMKALSDNKGYPRFVENPQTKIHRLWYFEDTGQPFADFLYSSLLDMGENRLRKMDASGVDIQLVSLSAPGIEQLDPRVGTSLATKSNDALARLINKHPDRFMGYAALAPKDPEAAARELERAVLKLGFKGWNTHSNYGDSYLDDKRYLPILQTAEKLGVPVYLHPTVPAIPQTRSFGFALSGAGFGFGMETALCMMRLIYAGVFDRCPGLKVILGHLGEGLAFVFKRINWAYVRPIDPSARPDLARKPSEYLGDNVFVTTSGNYYEPAFQCTLQAWGIDRILLGTDFPYEDPDECMGFIEGLPIPRQDKDKIYSLNAASVIPLS
ncbi:MAG: amidohydrolase [Deltaproteobacteria bacterium]|nr:amidohydrolase [Deltaproteobacteria bacterium]